MTCYYVYLHRKKTNGEVFYVGKGCGDRAWVKDKRNKYWNNVVKKHGCVVEIYQDNLQEWYAFEIEQDLIIKYGRRINNSGSLCNITTGGEGCGGDACSMYDHTVWTFYNVYSSEEVNMTRYNFSKKYKDTHVNMLFSDKNTTQSSKGWVVKEKVPREHIKALQESFRNEYSSRADKKDYCFINIDTGEKFTGTKWAMLAIHPHVVVDSLVYRTKKTSKRWALQDTCESLGLDKLRNPFSRSNHPASDHEDYSFTNMYNGDVFVGTRCELEDVAGINTGSLFNHQPKLTVKGWCLTANIDLVKEKARNDFTTYTFVHEDGKVFCGDRRGFKLLTGICSSPLFLKKPYKSTKGWSLVKEESISQ